MATFQPFVFVNPDGVSLSDRKWDAQPPDVGAEIRLNGEQFKVLRVVHDYDSGERLIYVERINHDGATAAGAAKNNRRVDPKLGR